MQKFDNNIYIIEKLGQGGMGEVFKAKIVRSEQGFEKIVALKVLAPYANHADKKREALLKEARIAANLNHPNINQVFDVGVKDNSPYIIMDFIEGHDLREIIKVAKEKNIYLSLNTSIEIMLSLLNALEYAHSLPSPIIHRDLSPHNVMVTKQGIVKLLDFGLSKIQNDGELSKTEGYVGKYSYLAPELLDGETYKKEHDIYVLGLIFYELLTLEKAYPGNLEFEILKQVKDGFVEKTSHLNLEVTSEIDDLLIDWLAKDPSDRISEAGSIKDRLISIKKSVLEKLSVKDEIFKLFDAKVKDNKTILEKRVERKNRKNFKYVFFLIPLLLIYPLYKLFKETDIERVPPFIDLKIGDSIVDISPEKLAYKDFASIENGGHFTKRFCEYYCHTSISHSLVFLIPTSNNLLDKKAGSQSMTPIELYDFFLSFYVDSTTSENYSKSCSHISLCQDAEKMRLFFKVHRPSFKGRESFKEISEKNRSLLTDSTLLNSWHQVKLVIDKQAQNIDLLNETLSHIDYADVKAITGLDLVTMPNDEFPIDSYSCGEWGSLVAFQFEKFVKGETSFLLLPKNAAVEVLGLRDGPRLLLNNIGESSIFEKGLCFVKIKNFKIIEARYWIPKASMLKSGTQKS